MSATDEHEIAPLDEVLRSVASRYAAMDDFLKRGTITADAGVQRYAWLTRKERPGNLSLANAGAAILTEANDQEKSIPFTISTFMPDRDGDVVVPRGCKLEEYRLNPVVFFGHQENPYPIAKSESPDGKLTVRIEDQRIRAVAYFDLHDEDAMFVYDKVRRGFLRAASIAFVPIKAWKRSEVEKAHSQNDGAPLGWWFDEISVTEWSVVGVPSNAGAIRDVLDGEKSHISPRMQKALGAYAAKSTNESGGCWTGWCPTVGGGCAPCAVVVKQVAKGAVNEALAATKRPGAHLTNASQVEGWANNQYMNQSSAQREFKDRKTFVAAVVEAWKQENPVKSASKSLPGSPLRKSCGCGGACGCKSVKKSVSKSVLLTRAEYDKLIQEQPEFMKTEYPKLKRVWSIGGVTVSGNVEIENKLRQMVGKSVRKNDESEKSRGHVAFVNGMEYYVRDNGALYHASIRGDVMTDGYRAGRWECDAPMVDRRLEMLGLKKSVRKDTMLAPPFTTDRKADGWWVLNGRGAAVSGPFASSAQAEQERATFSERGKGMRARTKSVRVVVELGMVTPESLWKIAGKIPREFSIPVEASPIGNNYIEVTSDDPAFNGKEQLLRDAVSRIARAVGAKVKSLSTTSGTAGGYVVADGNDLITADGAVCPLCGGDCNCVECGGTGTADADTLCAVCDGSGECVECVGLENVVKSNMSRKAPARAVSLQGQTYFAPFDVFQIGEGEGIAADGSDEGKWCVRDAEEMTLPLGPFNSRGEANGRAQQMDIRAKSLRQKSLSVMQDIHGESDYPGKWFVVSNGDEFVSGPFNSRAEAETSLKLGGKKFKSVRKSSADTEYDQGYVAAWDGRARSTNPYRNDAEGRGPEMQADWDAGWVDGAKERLSGRKNMKRKDLNDEGNPAEIEPNPGGEMGETKGEHDDEAEAPLKHSAQVAKDLHAHHKAAEDYLTKEMAAMDNPPMVKSLQKHLDKYVKGAMEDVKGIASEHHPDVNWEKAFETDGTGGGETEPGEAGLVSTGEVPEMDLDEDAVEEKSLRVFRKGRRLYVRRKANDIPWDRLPLDRDAAMARGYKYVVVLPPGNGEPMFARDMNSATTMLREYPEGKGNVIQIKGEHDDDSEVELKDGDTTSDAATEEILERYQNPSTKKWTTVKHSLRRAKSGQLYLVRGKSLDDMGNPAELRNGAGPNGALVKDDNADDSTSGSGGTFTSEHAATVTKAAEHMEDVAAKGEGLSSYHKSGLEHHAEQLKSVCKDLRDTHDSGEGAGPHLTDEGNPAELKSGEQCTRCNGKGRIESEPGIGYKCPACDGTGKKITTKGEHDDDSEVELKRGEEKMLAERFNQFKRRVHLLAPNLDLN